MNARTYSDDDDVPDLVESFEDVSQPAKIPKLVPAESKKPGQCVVCVCVCVCVCMCVCVNTIELFFCLFFFVVCMWCYFMYIHSPRPLT